MMIYKLLYQVLEKPEKREQRSAKNSTAAYHSKLSTLAGDMLSAPPCNAVAAATVPLHHWYL
jgi:hypothetical protein